MMSFFTYLHIKYHVTIEIYLHIIMLKYNVFFNFYCKWSGDA